MRIHRRSFLLQAAAAAATGALPRLQFAHREASMQKVGDPSVFAMAASIPGLDGVELQAAASDLWSLANRRRYRAEAHRCGMRIPSLAGPFARGVSIRQTAEAERNIGHTIDAAEFLGAGVILVPFFRDNCPSMDDESQWRPVVELLRRLAPRAHGAGVTLALENSLSPAGNVLLCDRIGHPAVRIYYDLDNCEFYGHRNQSVPGVALLGGERIRQVHVKNEDRLVEQPGRVDWKAAFAALRGIGYGGWIVFESRHSSHQQCIESTARNVAFVRGCMEGA